MRRLLMFAVDFAAIYVATNMAYDAGGVWAGLVAGTAVAAYGCVCYWDGMTR